MRDIVFCLLLIPLQLFIFDGYGRIAAACLKMQLTRGMRLLYGVFVYFGLLQFVFLPCVLTKQRFTLFAVVWMIVMIAVLIIGLFLTRKSGNTCIPGIGFKQMTRMPIFWIMLFFTAIQFYYIVTNEYFGYDTSYYIGDISNALIRDHMYWYTGDTGKMQATLQFRYALSGFYMNHAVWCKWFSIEPLYYTKFVQGGLMAVLSNVMAYQLGIFLFSGKKYENTVTAEMLPKIGMGMVLVMMWINLCHSSVNCSSDFLMDRAMEAKSYCANLVLPFIFLCCMNLWREFHDKSAKLCLFGAMLASVSISMSTLVIAPAMITILLLPILLKEKKLAAWRFYIVCMLPNTCYIALYGSYVLFKFRIGV